jgi:hypothetical protein
MYPNFNNIPTYATPMARPLGGSERALVPADPNPPSHQTYQKSRNPEILPKKLPSSPPRTSPKAGQTGPLESGFHHSPVSPEQQISDTHTGNLAPLIPAAPLAHDVFSLLLCPSFASPMVGASQHTVPGSRVKKAPSRQSRSCKVCRARKVKV